MISKLIGNAVIQAVKVILIDKFKSGMIAKRMDSHYLLNGFSRHSQTAE